MNRAVPAMLLCSAGVAVATNPPTTNGQRDAEYGAALTTQISSVISIFSPPYALTLGVNNSNVGGVAALVAGNIVSPPQDVLTGLEFKIPLAEAGWNGSDPIKISCFVNGGSSDYLSNQVSGGLDPLAPLPAGINIGGGAIPIFNFGGVDTTPAAGGPWDYSAGNQYVTVTQTQANATVTVDGTLDGTLDGAPYGPYLYENLLNPTGFGDSTSANVDIGSGSEIDAVRAFRDTLGTPATSDDILYVHVAGNLENNGNKFELFLDVNTGGANQNPLPFVPSPNWGGLNAMRTSGFDAAFAPDYYIRYNTYGSSPVNHAMDAVKLGTSPGTFAAGPKASQNPQSIPLGPGGFGPIQGTVNNSNVGGISFTGGGTGVDAAYTTNPNTVTTGVEFSIDLGAIGWNGTDPIKLGGFITQGNLLSNQVIGGVPANTNNLGLGPVVNFNTMAGNQYVQFSPVPSGTAPTINGTAEGSYTLLYANNAGGKGNSTNLGNATTQWPAGPFGNPNGSEIDSVWAMVYNNGDADPLTNTLYCVVGGNFNDFRRLAVFIDAKAGGQQVLRDDTSSTAGNYFNNLAGLTWDAAFAPDFAIVYNLGRTGDGTDNLPNTSDDIVSHYVDGAELLTNGQADPEGPPSGGFFGGGLASANITGNLVSRTGFGNNTLPGPLLANGSEADGLYLFVEPGVALHLFVAGNLEQTFPRVDVFLDITEGGQNTLYYDADPIEIETAPGSGIYVPNPDYTGNPNIDSGRLNNMGGPYPIPGTDPQEFEPGFTFDSEFTADYFVYATSGNVNQTTQEPEWYGGVARLRDALDTDPNTLVGADPGQAFEWGSTNATSGGIMSNPSTLAEIWINNSNVGGVAGGTDQYEPYTTNPATVATGLEILIPLDEGSILVDDGFGGFTNWDGTTPFKICVFINGEFQSYLSNQFLPPVCAPELGNPRTVNLESQWPGDQFAALTNSGSLYTKTNGGTILTACIEPTGACCDGASCSDNVLESVCLAINGAVFQGGGTTCLSNPCPQPEGACCIGVSCAIANESDCVNLFSGLYQGDDTNCDVNPCTPVDPTGACCFACTGTVVAPCPDPSGPVIGCQILTAAQCASARGLYVGNNTTCTQGVGGPCDCAGDINGDGNTNTADFNILAGQFGQGIPSCRTHGQGDLNCDGVVNTADFNILAGSFGCIRN